MSRGGRVGMRGGRLRQQTPGPVPVRTGWRRGETFGRFVTPESSRYQAEAPRVSHVASASETTGRVSNGVLAAGKERRGAHITRTLRCQSHRFCFRKREKPGPACVKASQVATGRAEPGTARAEGQPPSCGCARPPGWKKRKTKKQGTRVTHCPGPRRPWAYSAVAAAPQDSFGWHGHEAQLT